MTKSESVQKPKRAFRMVKFTKRANEGTELAKAFTYFE